MRKPLILFASLAACAIVGFTAATVIGAAGAPPPVVESVGKPGTDSIDQVVRDPKGKERDWAVTAFAAKDGRACVASGRKEGAKVSNVNPDDTFTPYPIEDGATCVDLGQVPAGVQVTWSPDATTVHGLAGPNVRSISLTVSGASRDLPLGPRRAFLAVLGPEAGLESLKVTATMKDGSFVTLIEPRPLLRR